MSYVRTFAHTYVPVCVYVVADNDPHCRPTSKRQAERRQSCLTWNKRNESMRANTKLACVQFGQNAYSLYLSLSFSHSLKLSPPRTLAFSLVNYVLSYPSKTFYLTFSSIRFAKCNSTPISIKSNSFVKICPHYL